MLRKCLYTILIGVLALGSLSACAPAAAPQTGITTKANPVAIGTISSTVKRLRPPRDEVVVNLLLKTGEITKNSTTEQIQSALAAYKAKNAKQYPTWISADVQLKAEQHERDLANGNLGTQSVQPIIANVFAMPVEFKDVTENLTKPGCTSDDKDVVGKGPMQGQIVEPPATDNNTLWYSASQTADSSFYSKMIFGYTGIVGRVRDNLTGPDGQPGFDLSGYTVQDYYDHVAGKGNVTLQGEVTEWITVDHSEAYYGAMPCGGTRDDGGVNPVGQLVPDSLAKWMAAHPSYYSETGANAFWKKYDANNDGYVDAFWIIHAGEGEEAGGGEQGGSAIWSHSWALSPQGVSPVKVYEGDSATTADDIYVDNYTMQPEIADIGVMTEEFGHNFFGFPDLYTNDAGNSVAFWSHMSAGSWGGPLGGSVPVSMPLWFKMIAQCGDVFCNWQDPMTVRNYDDSGADVAISQLERQSDTPKGVSQGVQINLPSKSQTVTNDSGGTGKAAWTGTGVDDALFTIEHQITVPQNATNELTVQTLWAIEDCRPSAVCDFAAVAVKDGNNVTYLSDSNFDTSFGTPYLLGIAAAPTVLHLDLSPFAGKTITLQFIYSTDGGYTEAGWWIDDIKLDGNLIDDFESATAPGTFPGWTNDNWQVVPTEIIYPQYYLVEWRNKSKYDSSAQTAYLTRSFDENGWNVSRIPYNIPGAVLYYRDSYQPGSGYALNTDSFWESPSMGPKLKLLVVDMNYGPTRFVSSTNNTVVLNTTVGSYDASLSLDGTPPFTLDQVNSSPAPLTGTNTYPSKAPVIRFDDYYGYYAGRYFGTPCTTTSGYCTMNTWGSAIIPASGDYSLRITDFNGNPLPEKYGVEDPGWLWPLGTGNPGDDGVAYGVKFSLIGQKADGTGATLRFDYTSPTLYSADINGPYTRNKAQQFSITTTNPTDKAYNHALLRYSFENVNLADIVSFEYQDGNDWLPMPAMSQNGNVIGYYGPETGSPISSQFVGKTNFRISFARSGKYNATFSLVDVDNQNEILTSMDATPVVMFNVFAPIIRH